MATYLKVTWNDGNSECLLPTKETLDDIVVSGGGGTIPLQNMTAVSEDQIYLTGSSLPLGNFTTAYVSPAIYIQPSTQTLFINKIDAIIDDGVITS